MGMIVASDILADLHVHTIASIHAYSTLRECLIEAKEHNMEYLAITDHYYNEGSLVQRKNEINCMCYLEEWVTPNRYGIKVIGGGEFNLNHEVFKKDRLMKRLHWRLLGTHSWFVDRKETTLDQLYQYFVDGIGFCNAFAHIEREISELDHKAHAGGLDEPTKKFLTDMVHLAKENNIYLELNEGTLARHKVDDIERLEFWLRLAKENGNFISLGTDAHYCELIGNFRRSIVLLNKIGFPKERIINCRKDLLDGLFVK